MLGPSATAAIDAIYLTPRRLFPLKFLIPGTVFLLAVVPQFLDLARETLKTQTTQADGDLAKRAFDVRALGGVDHGVRRLDRQVRPRPRRAHDAERGIDLLLRARRGAAGRQGQ